MVKKLFVKFVFIRMINNCLFQTMALSFLEKSKFFKISDYCEMLNFLFVIFINDCTKRGFYSYIMSIFAYVLNSIIWAHDIMVKIVENTFLF